MPTASLSHSSTDLLFFLLKAIPCKAEEDFKHLHYVPYTALITEARKKTKKGDKGFTFSLSGGIVVKGLDCHNKKLILIQDWLVVVEKAVKNT
jgi:hypothetical protein